MTSQTSEAKSPAWVDKDEYPFQHNYISTNGYQMHYVDEGIGRPVIFVHGNPTWSFMYRHLIQGVSEQYRCLAPDNIGYGLSEKPSDYTYLPADHSDNLEAFIEQLGLEDITLVLHDWGGPIAMDYAVKHPEKIHSLVLINTWFWPVDDDSYYRFWSRFMGGPIGRFLIKRFNFQTRFLMRQLSADDSNMSRRVHRQYIYPQKHSPREAIWILPREVLGSTDWLEKIWSKIDGVTDLPTLVIWAHRDTAFKLVQLRVLKEHFTNIWKSVDFPRSGHYLPEERGDDLVPHILAFLNAMDDDLPRH